LAFDETHTFMKPNGTIYNAFDSQLDLPVRITLLFAAMHAWSPSD